MFCPLIENLLHIGETDLLHSRYILKRAPASTWAVNSSCELFRGGTTVKSYKFVSKSAQPHDFWARSGRRWSTEGKKHFGFGRIWGWIFTANVTSLEGQVWSSGERSECTFGYPWGGGQGMRMEKVRPSGEDKQEAESFRVRSLGHSS